MIVFDHTRFKELRVNTQQSQTALAKKLKTSGAEISLVERGLKQPSPELVERIGKAFGLEPDTLYTTIDVVPDAEPPAEAQKTGDTCCILKQVGDLILSDGGLLFTDPEGILYRVYPAAQL